MKCAARGSLKI